VNSAQVEFLKRFLNDSGKLTNCKEEKYIQKILMEKFCESHKEKQLKIENEFLTQ
jgi:hypothetical protein